MLLVPTSLIFSPDGAKISGSIFNWLVGRFIPFSLKIMAAAMLELCGEMRELVTNTELTGGAKDYEITCCGESQSFVLI